MDDTLVLSLTLEEQYLACVRQGEDLLDKKRYASAAYSFVCARRVAQKLQELPAVPEVKAIWKTLETSAERKRKAANKLRVRRKK